MNKYVLLFCTALTTIGVAKAQVITTFSPNTTISSQEINTAFASAVATQNGASTGQTLTNPALNGQIKVTGQVLASLPLSDPGLSTEIWADSFGLLHESGIGQPGVYPGVGGGSGSGIVLGTGAGTARDAAAAITAETAAQTAANTALTNITTEANRALTAEALLEPKSAAVQIGTVAGTARDAGAAIAAESQALAQANTAAGSASQNASNLGNEIIRAMAAEAGLVPKGTEVAGIPLSGNISGPALVTALEGTSPNSLAVGNDPRIVGALQITNAGPLATIPGSSASNAITNALNYTPPQIGLASGTARDAAAAITAENTAISQAQTAQQTANTANSTASGAQASIQAETNRAEMAEGGFLSKTATFGGIPLNSGPTANQVAAQIGAVQFTPGDVAHLLLGDGQPIGLGSLSIVNNALYVPTSSGTGGNGAAGQGFTFRGAWTASTSYNPYDVLTYGGQSYVATSAFVSGATFSAANLSLIAAAGTNGATGPAGPTGPTGPTGGTGPTGPAGATGAQGASGVAGPAGATGAAGVAGSPGPTGAQGATGAQGPIGPIGQTGPAGPIGPGFNYRGAWAPSTAYNVNDVFTYQGTTYLVPIAFVSNSTFNPTNLTVFAAAGATGPTGPTGPTGATGPTGPVGPTGVQGVAGSPGATGNTGPQGPAGATGATGATGSSGPAGATGSAGAQGPQGPQGPAGSSASGGVATGTLFDCRNFGCQATGSLVTVQSKLGITTVSALQTYALPAGNAYAGVTPYAGINQGSWQHYATSQLLNGSASGATTLSFQKTISTSVASTSSNPTQIVMAAGGLNGVRPGLIVTANGNSDFSGSMTVSSVSPQGTDGNNNSFYLNGTPTTPAAAGHSFNVTQPLSPIAAALAAGLPVHICGQGVPTNTTVSAVNQSTGIVTLSTALTAATNAYDGVEFYWNYTNSEVAAMSMDTLGIQAALAYAQGQGGGKVILPGGTLVNNQTIILPTGSQQGSTTVDLDGASMNGTIISQSTDLGLGQYAMTCSLRLTGGTNCAGEARDFTLISANQHFAAGGAGSTLMSGIGWSGRRSLTHVNVEYFQTGYAITGDQTHFDDIRGFGNYYGMYWDYNNTYNAHDNFLVTKAIMGNNEMAALAVSANEVVNGSLFDGFVDGAGPFAFYKETGGNQNDLFSDTRLRGTQCEQPGIACRGEDRPWLQQVSADNNTRYESLEWGAYNSMFAPSGGEGATTAVFAMGSITHGYISPFDAFNWFPGAQGIFNVNYGNYGVVFEGDVQSVINTTGGATGNMFGPAMGTNGYGWSLKDFNWEAHLASFSTSGLTTQRLVCIHEVSPGTSQVINNCAGDAGDDPQGVLLQNGTINSAISIIIHKGDIDPQSTYFQLPKTTPTGTTFASNYEPQLACSAAGGGVQPGVGRSCPNGGVPVGAMFRGDSSNSFVHLNVGTW